MKIYNTDRTIAVKIFYKQKKLNYLLISSTFVIFFSKNDQRFIRQPLHFGSKDVLLSQNNKCINDRDSPILSYIYKHSVNINIRNYKNFVTTNTLKIISIISTFRSLGHKIFNSRTSISSRPNKEVPQYIV